MGYHYHNDITITAGHVELDARLVIPYDAKGIVIFTHGSGSGRTSPRNIAVAEYLHKEKFGTMLFDLLTAEEDKDYYNRFDIELLTKRLIAATIWLDRVPAAHHLPIAYFGASTGAAAALNAASMLPWIKAVVCRGGRPDLAMASLPDVQAPVLLLVGSLDYDVLQINQQAFTKLNCQKKLEVIPGATHLFQEEGSMQQVAELSAVWYNKYMQPVLNYSYS